MLRWFGKRKTADPNLTQAENENESEPKALNQLVKKFLETKSITIINEIINMLQQPENVPEVVASVVSLLHLASRTNERF
jgi:hypothetical protein